MKLINLRYNTNGNNKKIKWNGDRMRECQFGYNLMVIAINIFSISFVVNRMNCFINYIVTV